MKKKRGEGVTVQDDNALKNENNDRLIEFVFNNDGPEWERTVFYDFDSDDIYIPSKFFMSDMIALIALGYDGKKTITEKDHLYVPLKWAKKETKDKELFEVLKILDEKIREDLKPWEEYE